MASITTTPGVGKVDFALHYLRTLRGQTALVVATEIALMPLGLPIWAHLVLGCGLHIAINLRYHLPPTSE